MLINSNLNDMVKFHEICKLSKWTQEEIDKNSSISVKGH